MPSWITVLRKAEALICMVKTRVVCSRKIGTYGFLTVISALVYGIVFSYFTFLRHNSFHSAGWDLGNFNQAFYTTLFEGKLFYYTADSFFSPSGSLFAIHISPILFMFLPIYAVSPSPVTLLVVKAFGIGLAAIPLYLLSKELLQSNKAGFIIVLVYLLYAPLQGANWFDFQQSAFLPLLVFLTCYLMIKKKWKPYFCALVLTLMVEEHVAVLLAILAVYYLSYKYDLKSFFKSLRQLKASESFVPVLTIAVCLVYLFTALSIKNSFSVDPDFAAIYKATGNYAVLGSSDIFTLPLYVLQHPQRAFDALIYDFAHKFFYVVFLCAPLLFIPLKNRFSFGIIFLLMPFLFSNYRPYYLLGVHYPFYIVPMIFVAAISGLHKLESSLRLFNLKTMVVVTLLFTICVSPLSSLSAVFFEQGFVNYAPTEFSLDENKKSLKDLLSLVPSNGSILTQNLIFPHVSNRLNAYVIPFSDYGRPAAMNQYLDRIVDVSEYVLLGMSSLDGMAKTILNKITDSNWYRPYALGRQAILFKRGYQNEPINANYTNYRVYEVYGGLLGVSALGELVDDPSSISGNVLRYPSGVPDYCVFGPYDYLLQGSYEVTFRIMVGEHGNGCLGTLDVASNESEIIMSLRDIYGFELNVNEWTDVAVPFSLPEIMTRLEFRVFSNGKSTIYVDRIIVKRLSQAASGNLSLKTLRLRDLKLANGNITDEGFMIHPRGTENRVFWYGPYWTFSPGKYNVTFFVRTSPSPQGSSSRVLTLDVWGRRNEASQPLVLAERTIFTQDFTANGNFSEWRSFTLDFMIEETFMEVEFRGLFPTPDYDVYLGFIMLMRVE